MDDEHEFGIADEARVDSFRDRTVVLYLAVQFLEVVLFLGVVIFAILARPRHHSLALLGAGLLAGKAVTLILAPLGWPLNRRTALGYGFGLGAAAIAAAAFRSQF